MNETTKLAPKCCRRPGGHSSAMLQDETLFKGKRVGESLTQEEFAEVCNRYAHAAYKLSNYITRNPDLAEEAVQETMLALWKSSSQLEPGNLKAWIMRSVANKSINQMRGRSRRNSAMKRFQVDRNSSLESNEEEVEKKELLTHLQEHVSSLSDADRELVALHYVANLSQLQIARQLGVPQTTISGRIQRVLKGLRAKLLQAGLAGAIPELGASDIQHAIFEFGSIPDGFVERLRTNLDAENVQSVAVNPQTLMGWVAFVVVGCISGVLVYSNYLDDGAGASQELERVPEKESKKMVVDPDASTQAEVEHLFSGDFAGPELDSFWDKVPSSKNIRFGKEDGESLLILKVSNLKKGPDAKFKEIHLTSKPITLANNRSVVTCFTVQAPRLSGTVEYGYQFLNSSGKVFCQRMWRIKTLPVKRGFSITRLDVPVDKSAKTFVKKSLPLDSIYRIFLEEVNDGNREERVMGELKKTTNFDKGDHWRYFEEGNYFDEIGKVRVRFLVRAYPGSTIEWYLNSGSIIRFDSKLPFDVKSTIVTDARFKAAK